MSPFLFILTMEGLHAMVSKAVNTGLFKGASIGHGNINISHLLYADDAIFINVHKSKLSPVNVPGEDVSNMALVLGCGVAKLPMMYLGCLLVATWGDAVLGNLPTYYMSLYWMPKSVQNRIESMRNIFFLGGDLDEKKLTWVKWETCLASKAMGGLGIGSIFVLNDALLFKWIWRFRTYSNSLWVNVIKEIHGTDGGIGTSRAGNSTHSPWNCIVQSASKLQAKGIDLLALCSRSVGDGHSISFWNERWCGGRTFKEMFPHVYTLEVNKSCTVAQRINIKDWPSVLRRSPRGGAGSNQLDELLEVICHVSLFASVNGWKWELDISGFSVSSARSYIDEHTLLGSFTSTRWLRCIPIKVNDLWGLLARWYALDIPEVSNIVEWYSWLDTAHVSNHARSILEGIASTMLWSIWNFRNASVFSMTKPKKANIWDSIVHQSFLWISSRNPKCRFRWLDWLRNPIETHL
ncbi:hypothetical protein Tco_0824541 [Tanacetum coccineum]|uniref:RNA-directed DNA polymerase, eukaryota, reverse transcriptase zinc-binding domain protein n=1 Tax=Tanacetum coccineum TaxID=301880 RepID=A0ABQ5APG2_9ASTR